MPAYFDSSVLLSLISGDKHASRAYRLWADEADRVSSTLLAIECAVVLRRLKKWDTRHRNLLEQSLEEITLKPVDDDIAQLVRQTARLDGCHSLDATHVATALYFAKGSEDPLVFSSFDLRMCEVARSVGLRLD